MFVTVGVALSESAAPHEGQKRLPSGTRLSQAGQVIAAGIVYSQEGYRAYISGDMNDLNSFETQPGIFVSARRDRTYPTHKLGRNKERGNWKLRSFRTDVANRDYHYLSLFEIDGAKRISRHLSFFVRKSTEDNFRLADNPSSEEAILAL